MSDELSGFDEFDDELQKYMDKADDAAVSAVLKVGAEEFRTDLLRLPSPRSSLNIAGHTHLVDTFAIRQEKNDWLVGWGKYYGPIVEHGWHGAGRFHKSSHGAIPHFKPTFAQNRDRYYQDMKKKFES